jgi:hypothetical protein
LERGANGAEWRLHSAALNNAVEHVDGTERGGGVE